MSNPENCLIFSQEYQVLTETTEMPEIFIMRLVNNSANGFVLSNNHQVAHAWQGSVLCSYDANQVCRTQVPVLCSYDANQVCRSQGPVLCSYDASQVADRRGRSCAGPQ